MGAGRVCHVRRRPSDRIGTAQSCMAGGHPPAVRARGTAARLRTVERDWPVSNRQLCLSRRFGLPRVARPPRGRLQRHGPLAAYDGKEGAIVRRRLRGSVRRPTVHPVPEVRRRTHRGRPRVRAHHSSRCVRARHAGAAAHPRDGRSRHFSGRPLRCTRRPPRDNAKRTRGLVHGRRAGHPGRRTARVHARTRSRRCTGSLVLSSPQAHHHLPRANRRGAVRVTEMDGR